MNQVIANSRAFDPIALATLSKRLEGIARKMAATLLRTGRSGVLNIARDLSCCIVTADCRLLIANEALPIHVLSGPDLMTRVMAQFHPTLRRGDAFLNNSPYHGCSHAADHTLLAPIIDDAGRHRFTVVVKAHQADIGNSIPTTYHGAARDVYEEGALIFPCVRIQTAYELSADFVRMCEMRIRVSEQWHGDLLAMIGAARIGERELVEIAGELGWDTLDRFAEAWFDYSERRMVDAIRSLPAGTSVRYSVHDPFPGTPVDGVSIGARVTLNSEAAEVEVDLRENVDCLPCGLNLSEACARTAAMVGVFNSLGQAIPTNAGSFRRIRVLLRDNCVVGIPRHPTSTSVATTNIADRVANAVQSAIAEIAPGYGLAECGAVIPPACGVISGAKPNGERFVNQVFLGMTAGAGAPTTDAWLTICHVGNAGLCYLDSIELDEMRQPIVVHRRALVRDSEGAGTHRGAPSIEVVLSPSDDDICIAYVSDGSVNPARGVRGGGAGGRGAQSVLRADGTTETLPGCAQVTLAPGDRLVSVSTGGGGYGPPWQRDACQVGRDVAEKWISIGRAREIYGVVTSDDGSIDLVETAKLRRDTRTRDKKGDSP